MEKHIFTRECLSCVRVIMMIMRVSMVKLLCQMSMGRISALEYVLSGAREFLWLRLVMLGNKYRRFLRPQRR
jgi:hypothetical protein